MTKRDRKAKAASEALDRLDDYLEKRIIRPGSEADPDRPRIREKVQALREALEALADESRPATQPGRAPHGPWFVRKGEIVIHDSQALKYVAILSHEYPHPKDPTPVLRLAAAASEMARLLAKIKVNHEAWTFDDIIECLDRAGLTVDDALRWAE